MKTYTFRVALEPDEDGWHIYVPELRSIGASTWGYTREDALIYIREVLEMIIEEFEEEGKPLPSADAAAVADGLAVTLTVLGVSITRVSGGLTLALSRGR